MSAVTLYIGKSDVVRKIKEGVRHSYGYSVHMVEVTDHLNNLFGRYDVCFVDARGKSVDKTEYRNVNISRNTYTPMQQITQLAYFLSDSRNIAWYVSHMPDDARKIYSKIISDYYVKKDWVEEVSESRMFSSKMRWEQVYSGWYCWLDVSMFLLQSRYQWLSDHYFHLPPAIYQCFAPAFSPSFAQPLTALDIIPETPKLAIFNEESLVEANFMLVYGLYLQGAIAPGKTKLLMKTSLKKLADLNLKEFFPTSRDEEILHLRTQMLGQAIAMFLALGHQSKKIDHFDTLVKAVVDELGLSIFDNQVYLPFIKGLSSSKEYTGLELVEYSNTYMKQLEEGKWYSVEDYHERAKASGKYNETILKYDESLGMEYHYVNTYTDKKIMPECLIRELGCNFLDAYLFMLASLGALEIAYDDKPSPKKYASPFASVKYFRLTNLGLYIFEQKEAYASSYQATDTAYFELDSHRLLVRNIVANNPYASLLKDVSRYIGGDRYEISASTFLANCTSKNDVEQKIGIFKHFISSELPEVWATFFDDMLQHCNPLSNVKQKEYKLFTIDAKNRSLMKLIVTDAVLRKVCVRAENHLLLVRQTDLETFEQRMKALGYLL